MANAYELAVFGDPISHSRSPEIHQAFARQAGLAVNYTRVHAPAAQFPDQLQAFQQEGGVGANVTVPLKEQAATLCQELSSRARQAGAVNTLSWQGAGWLGDNTDGAGLVLDLQRQGIQLPQCRVLVIGAGGAARGVLGPLLAAGAASILVVNRTLARAETLAQAFPGVSAGPLEAASGPVDLVIQATSAGLHRQAPELPASLWRQRPFCYDMQYGPTLSPFLTQAQAMGCEVADGLGMLVGQAAVSFEIWTGFAPSLAPVLQALTAVQEP